MSSQPSVYALVDGPLGEKVENWLQDRNDIRLDAAFSGAEQLSEIPDKEPDLIISAGYTHLIPEEIINVPEKGAINLHYSYLPYARGANTNVWSIIDDHPAGVSIHHMVDKVDAGQIIARREVPIYPDDNGRDLYERLIQEQFNLFTEEWEHIRDGTASTQPNHTEDGTYHKSSEFDDLCKLELEDEMTIGGTIDLLRALTYPPYKNAYFTKDGKKYYVEIDITPEDDIEDSG
jgi:methionyl-tRNA formyltransferase